MAVSTCARRGGHVGCENQRSHRHVFVIALQLSHSLFPSHDICVVGEGFHSRFGEKPLQGKAPEILYVSMTSNAAKYKFCITDLFIQTFGMIYGFQNFQSSPWHRSPRSR